MSSKTSNQKGKMVIITAPSGAGKTTIVRHLLSKFDFLDFSISATTRSKRPHEVDGKDYYFKSNEEFQSLIETDQLVEWEEVYERTYYGTLASEVDRIWSAGHHIIFDIDVRGASNLQSRFRDHCLSIFVKPPSPAILFDRLIKRNTESPDSLKRRIDKAQIELAQESRFDTSLINDDLETTLKDAENLILSYIFGEEE